MMTGFLDWLRASAVAGAIAGLFTVLTMWIRTLASRHKVSLDGDAGLRADMMAQIHALRIEARDREDKCHREISNLTGQVMSLGRALMLVTSEHERINPDSSAVILARKVLADAFPLYSPPAGQLNRLALEIDRKNEAKS